MTITIKHDLMEWGRWFLAYYQDLMTEAFVNGYLPHDKLVTEADIDLWRRAYDAFRDTRHELTQIVAHYDALAALDTDNETVGEAADWAQAQAAARCNELRIAFGQIEDEIRAHPAVQMPRWLLVRPHVI